MGPRVRLFLWKLLHYIFPFLLVCKVEASRLKSAVEFVVSLLIWGFIFLLSCRVVVDVWAVMWPQFLIFIQVMSLMSS